MNSSLLSFCLTLAFLSSGLRPSHRLLLLLYPAEASSQLCGRLLRDQQPLLPASGGVSINSGAAREVGVRAGLEEEVCLGQG